MKKVCFLILIFLIANISSPAQYERILWNGKKLKWKEFKGVKDSTPAYDAVTYSVLEKKYRVTPEKEIHFTIAAWFYCMSWVKKDKNSFNLLEHEQGHFTLDELYARKIRKYLSESTFYDSSYKSQIDFLFNRFSLEAKREQKRYDEETSHSGNQIKQEDWLLSVNREMEQLSKYTDTAVVVKLR